MLMDYYILWRHATVFWGEGTEVETRKDATNVALVIAERAILAELCPCPSSCIIPGTFFARQINWLYLPRPTFPYRHIR
jgi:hypothetical protein